MNLRLERSQASLDFHVARSDQLLIVTVCGKRLAKREQMFGPIVSDKRFCNRVFCCLDTRVT